MERRACVASHYFWDGIEPVIRGLRERKHLNDSDADLTIHTLRDRGVISGGQGGDDRGLSRVTRSQAAVLDRGGLIARDNSTELRRLPVIVPH